MIHNQTLIHLLSVVAIVMPLPVAMSVFWLAFSSVIVIQNLVGLWAAATMTYVSFRIRNRVQDRAKRL
jgi:hypothetical protein